MTGTRYIAPVIDHRERPFWLAPVCALIVGSPFALAAGMAVAWVTGPDPAVTAQPEPADSPPPLVPATTEPAPSSSSYSEPTAEPTILPPRTVTRWRTADPAPPVTVTRTPAPTTTATTSTPTTTGDASVSTTPDETSAGATQTPGSTQ